MQTLSALCPPGPLHWSSSHPCTRTQWRHQLCDWNYSWCWRQLQCWGCSELSQLLHCCLTSLQKVVSNQVSTWGLPKGIRIHYIKVGIDILLIYRNLVSENWKLGSHDKHMHSAGLLDCTPESEVVSNQISKWGLPLTRMIDTMCSYTIDTEATNSKSPLPIESSALVELQQYTFRTHFGHTDRPMGKVDVHKQPTRGYSTH